MIRTRVGYAGGEMASPTYTRIGDHTEALAIDFDPSVISYDEVLSIIWQSHHPLKNFGGRQYRHAIWYHSQEQKAQAEASRDAVAQKLGVEMEKIQTALEPAGEFTYAEDYHQKYMLRRQRSFSSELAELFPDHIAFTDSTAMTRLNGWFGNGESASAPMFREEIASFGLPLDLENRILREIR